MVESDLRMNMRWFPEVLSANGPGTIVGLPQVVVGLLKGWSFKSHFHIRSACKHVGT